MNANVFRSALLDLAEAGVYSGDPTLRNMAMCISTLIMVGMADQVSPHGLEARLIQVCADLGDESKLVISEFQSVKDIGEVVERREATCEGRGVKKFPQNTLLHEPIQVIDEAISGLSPFDRRHALSDLAVAIGIRLYGEAGKPRPLVGGDESDLTRN